MKVGTKSMTLHEDIENRRWCVARRSRAVLCALVFTGCGDYGDSTSEMAVSTTPVESSATPSAAPSPAAVPTDVPTPAATPSDTAAAPAGPPPEATCENVTPCGGDVVGTWTATSSCFPVTGDLDMTSLGLGCTGAPTSGSMEVTGTWTLNGDGTIVDETQTLGQQQIDLPAACLDVSGTHTTCDRVGAPLSGLGFASATCTDDAATGGCSCPAMIDQVGGAALVSLTPLKKANYTVADNVITVSNGRTETQYAYCVSGASLILSPISATKVGTLAGTVVLQKQ